MYKAAAWYLSLLFTLVFVEGEGEAEESLSETLAFFELSCSVFL